VSKVASPVSDMVNEVRKVLSHVSSEMDKDWADRKTVSDRHLILEIIGWLNGFIKRWEDQR